MRGRSWGFARYLQTCKASPGCICTPLSARDGGDSGMPRKGADCWLARRGDCSADRRVRGRAVEAKSGLELLSINAEKSLIKKKVLFADAVIF